MKKVISITIALCLVFASVLPVYAEAWTNTQADSVTRNIQALVTAFAGSVGTMYNSISELMSWLTPVGSFNNSHSITGVTLYEIVDYIAWTLSGVGPTVYDTFQSMGYMLTYMPSLDSKLTTSNNYLTNLKQALTNYKYPSGNNIAWTWDEVMHYANSELLDNIPDLSDASHRNGRYTFYTVNDGGVLSYAYDYWQNGSPIANVVLALRRLNSSIANSYHYRWAADLLHYNDNLTTWDSQGSTLTQVPFTPDSAIQGLYRYLAFTQRDVARLAYVFANDEELEARELAQANQEQVLDDFIDPNGSGSVSPTDLGNMTDASDGFKSNFSTNVGSSHIWDVFDNSRYNWFTQQTKNQLDTTQQTRTLKAVQNDYPTPLLDNYYNEIFGIIGVDIND